MTTERPAPTPHAAQQTIVLVYTSVPSVMAVEAIKKIRGNGGRVVLLGPQIKGYENAAEISDSFVFLRQRVTPVYVDPDNRPRRYSPTWASIVARNLIRKATFKPAKRTLGAATLWWMAARNNRQALHLIDSADVITATDAGSIYLVWEAARRNRHAAAINGIGPTLEHLGLAR